jgi:molybdopterin molybdotransferase
VKPFLDLITAERAYEVIGSAFSSLGTERIDARRAAGRVLAETLRAAEDVPCFERSNMDGFAVRASDTYGASETSSVVLRLAGGVAMGTNADVPVEPGTAVRVSTGAMLPAGADAVVIVERTEELSGARVAIREAATPGQNLIAIAEDLAKGDLLLERGRRLTGGDVGAVTGAGHASVEVFRTPRVGIVVTGDEIIEPGVPLAPGQVRNVNQYSLSSLARAAGAHVNEYGVCRDEETALDAVLARAIEECDAVFVSGGSSKGERDLTRAAFERAGAEILVHGIAIAPGKPTIVARTAKCALVGLPGNPAAAVVVFTLFGSTLVRVLEGEALARILVTRATTRARLARAVGSTPGREDYFRVRLENGEDGSVVAVPQPGKSVAISTIARADGLLRVPISSDGLPAGAEVEVLLL